MWITEEQKDILDYKEQFLKYNGNILPFELKECPIEHVISVPDPETGEVEVVDWFIEPDFKLSIPTDKLTGRKWFSENNKPTIDERDGVERPYQYTLQYENYLLNKYKKKK